ncbi:hypothetical protein MASR2M78_01150 [Treponema sp.]
MGVVRSDAPSGENPHLIISFSLPLVPYPPLGLVSEDMNRYYFDWAATGIPTYSLQETAFGNPSSRHAEGRASRAALEDARLRIARLLGVDASCLYFTSGATESNAIVLQSLLQRSTKAGMLISSIEHPAITENALALKRLGFPLSFIPVGASGHIQEDSIYQILQNDTSIRLLCVMAVNNETGAKMDMASLVRASREASGPRASSLHFHCDAVQALAKTDVDLRVWDVDSASFSAHKIGGPRGIGLLYLRKKIEAFTLGGSPEKLY